MKILKRKGIERFGGFDHKKQYHYQYQGLEGPHTSLSVNPNISSKLDICNIEDAAAKQRHTQMPES